MTYNRQWAEQSRDRLIKKTELKVAKAYKQAAKNIKSELGDLFEKYAEKGILTYAEMAKYNRLNSLYKTLQDELNESWNVIIKDTKELVKDAYNESYYQYGFLLSKDVGLNLSFGLISKDVIKSLFEEPNVSGLSLKETLSKTRYNLLLRERQAMTRGFIQGESYQNMARSLGDEFNKSFNDCLRIVRTEGTRAANDGQVAVYDDAEAMGVEFDRIWVATLDSRTRDAHQSLDGEKADEEGYFHFRGMKAKSPGDWGVAKMDINCRCTIISKAKDEQPTIRRSNIGDKNIIDYQTYEQWKKDQK